MIERSALIELVRDNAEVDDSILPALREAMAAADAFMLPQTVYLAPDAGDGSWAHTYTVSPRLPAARVFLTVLPFGFFEGWVS